MEEVQRGTSKSLGAMDGFTTLTVVAAEKSDRRETKRHLELENSGLSHRRPQRS